MKKKDAKSKRKDIPDVRKRGREKKGRKDRKCPKRRKEMNSRELLWCYMTCMEVIIDFQTALHYRKSWPHGFPYCVSFISWMPPPRNPTASSL